MAIDYPLFVPPEHLAEKGRRNWSAKEAKEYKAWLLGELDGRADALIVALCEPERPNPVEHLEALGQKAATLLAKVRFSEVSPRGPQLTNAGYALAADMGLLVARYLLRDAPEKLRWEVLRKPKSELSYNLPVLEGFSSTNYLEPVGGSIAEAYGVLRGARAADTWKRIYQVWMSDT